MVTADKLRTGIHRSYWPKRHWTNTSTPHGQSLLRSEHAPRTIYSLLSHGPTNTTTFQLANNFCNWLATQHGTLCLSCLAAFHTTYHRAEVRAWKTDGLLKFRQTIHKMQQPSLIEIASCLNGYEQINRVEGFFFPVALRPNAGHVLRILEVSRSHTTTHHSR
jgi:hypothetical protein